MTDTMPSISVLPPPASFEAPIAPSVHPDSPLAGLKARKAAIIERLHWDLKVPRWDDDGGPAIYVRYGPIDVTRMTKILDAANKSKAPDKMLVANANILANACLGVFAREDGSEEELSLRDGDPHGPLTRFDEDLAETLDVGTPFRATAVVRALYLTDGDLIAAAIQLSELSGAALPKADTDFLGE